MNQHPQKCSFFVPPQLRSMPPLYSFVVFSKWCKHVASSTPPAYRWTCTQLASLWGVRVVGENVSVQCSMFCLFQSLIFLKEHHAISWHQSVNNLVLMYCIKQLDYNCIAHHTKSMVCSCMCIISRRIQIEAHCVQFGRSFLQKVFCACVCPWGMWVFDLPDGNVVQDLQAS